MYNALNLSKIVLCKSNNQTLSQQRKTKQLIQNFTPNND